MVNPHSPKRFATSIISPSDSLGVHGDLRTRGTPVGNALLAKVFDIENRPRASSPTGFVSHTSAFSPVHPPHSLLA